MQKNLAYFNKIRWKKAFNNIIISAAPESTVNLLLLKISLTILFSFAVRAYKNSALDLRLSKPPINIEDIRK